MRETDLFRAIELRYPDVFASAVDKAWAVKADGGNDGAILRAMRSITHQIHGRLAAEGDDSIREEFAKLFLDQTRTIRAISGEACGKYLDGELDVMTVLSREQIRTEERWLLNGLAGAAGTESRDRVIVQRAVEILLSKLSKQHVEVMADLGSHRDEPLLMCDALISLYAQALALPPRYRAAALEGLFVAQ